MLCGGLKGMFLSSILRMFGVLTLSDCNLGVVKLGCLLQEIHRASRDCFGSDSTMLKVRINALCLP